jgi:hypothetical protein
MKYSKVQYDLWRVRARLDRKLAKMTPEQVQEYFDGVDKRVEAKLGRPLRLRTMPATMHPEGWAVRMLKLYIETSIWSHWFAEDAPDRREATREFFGWCRRKAKEVTLHTSALALQELRNAPPDLADQLDRLVREHSPNILEVGEQVKELAATYVRRKIVPPAKLADTVHAAIATVNEMDVLVSWNYRHLVNVRREAGFNAVNADAGYCSIRIASPLEVTEDEIQQSPD